MGKAIIFGLTIYMGERLSHEISRHWRLKGERFRLEGNRCTICGNLHFPPRPICLNQNNHILNPLSSDKPDTSLRIETPKKQENI